MGGQLAALAVVLAAAVALPGCGQQVRDRDEVTVAPTHSSDAREPLYLSAHERDLVLAEMRQMLESTEGVVTGRAANDLQAIQQAAARSGRRAPGTVDQAMHASLPENFLHLGMAAHGGFDDIARMAEEGADRDAMTARLGEVLRQCTSCHATYRVEVRQ
jgi:cytochrome c556